MNNKEQNKFEDSDIKSDNIGEISEREKDLLKEKAILLAEIESYKKDILSFNNKMEQLKSSFESKYDDSYQQLLKEFERKTSIEKEQNEKDKSFCIKALSLDLIEIYEVLLSFEVGWSMQPSQEKNLNSLLKRIKTILEKNSIRKININVGDKYDVEVASIVLTDSSANNEKGIITKVIQNGYYLGDAVLRHALVCVSS